MFYITTTDGRFYCERPWPHSGLGQWVPERLLDASQAITRPHGYKTIDGAERKKADIIARFKLAPDTITILEREALKLNKK